MQDPISNEFEKIFKEVKEDISLLNIHQYSDDEIINKLIPYGKKIEKFLELSSPSKTEWYPNYKNLINCNNIQDVQRVIKTANEKKQVVRVAGAQHSAPGAIFGTTDNKKEIHIKLQETLRHVNVINSDEDYLIVEVGAGCNLGVDPMDSNSTVENSFNRIVDKLGYALPILGGMSHQTIGGFMMTSTAGGSVMHGFSDVLESIEFVDGLGNVNSVNKEDKNFNAVAVSMGLLGVITKVKLKLPKNYLVQGTENTVSRKDSIIKDGKTFKKSLIDNEYIHSVWFPQPGVDRVLQFIGKQVPTSNKRKEYKHVLEKRSTNYLACLVLRLINEVESWNIKLLTQLVDLLLNVLNPLTNNPGFCDLWYLALPNDDLAMIDTLIRVQFTEIWIDIDRTEEVIDKLKILFDKDPFAGGNFGVELYAAKRSPFWMSQSYGRDVVRVDPYWFERNPKGNMYDFFNKYWECLLDIPTARLHWGKHFPKVGSTYGNITIGPDYVKKLFPKFQDWMKIRDELDPNQVFVTDYWKDLLGIPMCNNLVPKL